MCMTCRETTRRHFMRLLLATAGAGALSVCRAGAAVVKRPLPVVNLDFLPKSLLLRRRSCWTDAVPQTWQLREAKPYSRITVHHQGAGEARSRHENSVAADIDAIFGGHRRIGYADIGYHFVIDYDGRVWEGRSLAYAGAHVSGQNDGNIGILALGNFNRQKPSVPALAALGALAAALQKRYSIRPDQLYGHRELGASECPGTHLHASVINMRAAFCAAAKTTNDKGV